MPSPAFDPAFVRPLEETENQFLQVLVNRFRIRRKGHGFDLQVAFQEDSPSICLRTAKNHVLDFLPVERRAALQRHIDAFFASNEEEFDYYDPSFPFRLGNGGTLPVVRLKGIDYYCLLYRDRHPAGWNIANGGANNRQELLHPDVIVERELREELIIVEPEPGRWYVFDWHDASLRDHPDFALAHKLWTERFRSRGFPEFVDVALPLKWSQPRGTDYQPIEQRSHDTMHIRCGDGPTIHTGQGFLNINAEDYGIEFDRIAKISVGPEAVFCDGEIGNGGLLNRVVGLFAMDRVQALLADGGQQRFLPDHLYWDGECRTGEDPAEVIDAYLRRRGCSWAQYEENLQQSAAPPAAPDPFDLCPVTRAIIRRHCQLHTAEHMRSARPQVAPYDVFVSFASEDRALARRVYDHISMPAEHRVFFSDVTLMGGAFSNQIDQALDSAWAFVVVGSRVEHLYKSWVAYEWRSFHNDLNSGRKPTNAPFFAFVTGINHQNLPRPLRLQQGINADPADPTSGLARLPEFLVKP